MTDAARIELKAQGTQVIGVYAGFIDTDMAAGYPQSKTPPQQVAKLTLDGIRNGADHVRADSRSNEIWQAMRTDPAMVETQMQQVWDKRTPGQATYD